MRAYVITLQPAEGQKVITRTVYEPVECSKQFSSERKATGKKNVNEILESVLEINTWPYECGVLEKQDEGRVCETFERGCCWCRTVLWISLLYRFLLHAKWAVARRVRLTSSLLFLRSFFITKLRASKGVWKLRVNIFFFFLLSQTCHKTDVSGILFDWIYYFALRRSTICFYEIERTVGDGGYNGAGVQWRGDIYLTDPFNLMKFSERSLILLHSLTAGRNYSFD